MQIIFELMLIVGKVASEQWKLIKWIFRSDMRRLTPTNYYSACKLISLTAGPGFSSVVHRHLCSELSGDSVNSFQTWFIYFSRGSANVPHSCAVGKSPTKHTLLKFIGKVAFPNESLDTMYVIFVLVLSVSYSITYSINVSVSSKQVDFT